MLSRSNDTIFLSKGGFITLPADLVNDGDSDSLNEIQVITLNGNLVSISKGGGSVQLPSDLVNDADSSIYNEIQTLSLLNDTLYLTDGGSIFLGGYKNSSIINDSSSASSGGNDTIVGPRTLGGNQTTWLIDSVYIPGSLISSIDLKYNVSSLERFEMRVLNRQQFKQYMSGINPLAGLPLSEPSQSLTFYSDVFSTSVRGGSCCGVAYRDIELNNYRSYKVNYTHNDRGYNTALIITKSRHEVLHIENPTDRLYIFTKGSNTHIDYRAEFSSNSVNSNGGGIQSFDNDSTNELQTLYISNDTIYLTNGGYIVLPSSIYSSSSAASSAPIDYLTLTGTVAGTLNPTTITSGANMNKVTVPADKVYNIRHVKLVGAGVQHNQRLKINGIEIWHNTDDNGDCDIWLGPGDELEHFPGEWGGANGSFSDSWLISIHIYDSSQVARTTILTGTVAGTLNPTTITSGANMNKVTVPADKVYNIRHVKLVGAGVQHNQRLKINGIEIWHNTDDNGDCDIWLGPGDELEHFPGEWGGANGSFSDSWLISIREYDK